MAQKEAEESGESLQVDVSDLSEDAVAGLVVGALGIDWDPSTPMTEDELSKALTGLVKGLVENALKSVLAGDVVYRDPYQVHKLLEMLLKETHLARGEPTEIHKKSVEVQLLPDDDIVALSEGIKRLKMIAERRDAALESGEDVIDAEEVEDASSGSE